MGPALALSAVWRPALFALRNGALLAASAAVAGLAGGTIVATGSLVGLAIAAGLVASIAGDRANMRREQHPLTTVLAPEFMHLQAHSWWVSGTRAPSDRLPYSGTSQIAPSGGSVSSAEWYWSIHGTFSASTPPRLPWSEPP